MFEKVRTVRFAPYAPGKGPQFTLHLFDANQTDSAGRFAVGYELRSEGRTLFSSSEMHSTAVEPGLHSFVWVRCAIDSDDAVRTVRTFLTLRPGDTDADYFADYSDDQRDFCDLHAEVLAAEVEARFARQTIELHVR